MTPTEAAKHYFTLQNQGAVSEAIGFAMTYEDTATGSDFDAYLAELDTYLV